MRLVETFPFSTRAFPEDRTLRCTLHPEQDPAGTEVTLQRGPLGRTWSVVRGIHCFRVSIEDGHPHTVAQLLRLCDRVPLVYMPGLEIVSDRTEEGLSLYKDLGRIDDVWGAIAGLGSADLIHKVGLHLNVLLHEIAHAVEDHLYDVDGPGFMERWRDAIRADAVSVSQYGDRNPREDCAEYAEVYAMATQTGRAAELRRLSPQRYALWREALLAVNTTSKPMQCIQYTPPEDAVQKTREAVVRLAKTGGPPRERDTVDWWWWGVAFLVVLVAVAAGPIAVAMRKKKV